MIMAAGVGSRLMPLTIDIPKPMIPMVNQPLMEITLNLLHEHGFREIIANLHYQKQVISEHFCDGQNFGMQLGYSPEDELLGTAGGVKNCEWFLDDCFVVVSGDALTDADITYLWAQHKKNGALATIALKEVEEVEQFGVVVTDDRGKIEQFQEKPKQGEALSHLANTGIYIFEPEIFKYIPPRQFYDFGKQVFPELVRIGAPFFGVPIDNYWCDVGDLETYRQAHADILQGKLKANCQPILCNNGKGRIVVGEAAQIADDVHFEGNVVIGNNCSIEAGAFICDSVIWDNSIVETKSRLTKCIVGRNCKIGRSVTVNPKTVIASGCEIVDKTNTAPGQKINSVR
ncbi:MAG: NDP-sugar synthase [Syntrophomonadaceae bacterium]|nr:NDP-sugar synthase [Syntrophomonadaceae bacterium]MDD3023328.1 NDP-sugar synthase [Syntrophomonadaceae bacterium]